MIKFEHAYATLMENIFPIGETDYVPLIEATGRVLALDITALDLSFCKLGTETNIRKLMRKDQTLYVLTNNVLKSLTVSQDQIIAKTTPAALDSVITIQDLARQTNVKISTANAFLKKALVQGTVKKVGGFSGHYIYQPISQ